MQCTLFTSTAPMRYRNAHTRSPMLLVGLTYRPSGVCLGKSSRFFRPSRVCLGKSSRFFLLHACLSGRSENTTFKRSIDRGAYVPWTVKGRGRFEAWASEGSLCPQSEAIDPATCQTNLSLHDTVLSLRSGACVGKAR